MSKIFYTFLADHKIPYNTKTDILNIFIITVLWSMMAIIVNPIGDFPLNDDWVYASVVKSILETGIFKFSAESSANVGPQVYWGYLFCVPFGFSFTALRVSTLVIGLLGVITLYLITRELGGKRHSSMLGALVLVVNPLYFGLSNTFMTDVPFLALVIITFFFLVRWFKYHLLTDITFGLFFSFTAILVRQFGIVVLIAFAIAYLIQNGYRIINLIKAFLPLLIGIFLHLAYQNWIVNTDRMPKLSIHRSIGELLPDTIDKFSQTMVDEGYNIAIYVGFFLAPIVFYFFSCRPREIIGKWPKVIQVAFFILLILFLGLSCNKERNMPSTINVLIESGMGPLTLRDTFLLNINNPNIPIEISTFWVAATILSVIAASIVLYQVVFMTFSTLNKFSDPISRTNTWPYYFFSVTSIAYCAIILLVASKVQLFDRYLLLFIPIYILLNASEKNEEPPPSNNTRLVLSYILLLIYLVFSVAATHDYISWNRIRWVALHNLMEVDKISPNHIDGGYEFNGSYTYDARYQPRIENSYWWVRDDEYIVAFGSIPNYTVHREYPFQRWLPFSNSNILVLRRNLQTN